jgi:hypothetical protein
MLTQRPAEEGRRPQAGIADICLHGVTGDAFPRLAARQ